MPHVPDVCTDLIDLRMAGPRLLGLGHHRDHQTKEFDPRGGTLIHGDNRGAANTPMNTISVTENENRVVVTLNRPPARNAINDAMVGELHDVCTLLENRPRPLLLTRAEGNFASGAEIAELRVAMTRHQQSLVRSDRPATLSTIAAVDGYALGGVPNSPTPAIFPARPPTVSRSAAIDRRTRTQRQMVQYLANALSRYARLSQAPPKSYFPKRPSCRGW